MSTCQFDSLNLNPGDQFALAGWGYVAVIASGGGDAARGNAKLKMAKWWAYHTGTTKVPNLPAQINFIQKYDDGTIDAQRRAELATLFNNLVRAPATPEPVVADPNFKTVQAFQHVPTITAQPVALGLYKVMYKQKTK